MVRLEQPPGWSEALAAIPEPLFPYRIVDGIAFPAEGESGREPDLLE